MNDEAWSCAFWGIKVLLINSERLARSENFTIRSIPPRIRIKTVANRALHTWGRFDFETSDVNQPLPSTCLWVVALQVWRQDTHTHTHLKSFKQNYHELSVSALGQAECMERASTCFAHIWSPNSPSFFWFWWSMSMWSCQVMSCLSKLWQFSNNFIVLNFNCFTFHGSYTFAHAVQIV